MTKLGMVIASSIVALAAGVSLADPPARPLIVRPALPRLSLPSDTGHGIGYYVGGGALPRFGEPRGADEGTWGWDYQGWLLPRRVVNSWWHGRRYQGGTGAYKTDGPHFYSHDAKAR